jgi:hypothetical protein
VDRQVVGSDAQPRHVKHLREQGCDLFDVLQCKRESSPTPCTR